MRTLSREAQITELLMEAQSCQITLADILKHKRIQKTLHGLGLDIEASYMLYQLS